MQMNAERKYWVALAALLLIFSGVAAASTYELILDPAAPVEGSTLYVTLLKDGNPEPKAVVQFVLNGGLPVLNMTDADGRARFKPPVNGTLDIFATTQDGTPLDNGHVVVSAITPTPTPTPTPTQTNPPSSGGSSGGTTGGPGVVTSEPPENIARSETSNGTLQAGNPVTYVFSSPEHWIYEIVITGKATEQNIVIRVEALKGLSKRVPSEPSQSIKKYVNIWSGSKNMQEAIIRFKVENSVIASEGVADSDVKMLKWDGTSWIALETTVAKKDSTYTYYNALTTTFSHFAISLGPVVPAVNAASAETSGATETSVPARTSADATTENAPAGSNLYLILYVLTAIVIVSVVYLLTKHGKPK